LRKTTSIAPPTTSKDTLQEHFDQIAKEGQEYDPYTTME